MNNSMPVNQSGYTFGGLMIGAFVLILISSIGLKVIPPYMENAKIENTFVIMAHAPELQNASSREILRSFSRRSTVDNITAIEPSDIEISSENGALVLSASYAVTIPLLANASLYIKFNPSSASK